MRRDGRRGRSIFVVLPQALLVRAYLCTPLFDRLLKLRDETGLELVFFTEMDTVRPFLEAHGCRWEPLVRGGGPLWRRAARRLRGRYLHRAVNYRFNEIHGFTKHRRKRRISHEIRQRYPQLISAAHDRWPRYLGWPIPRSTELLHLLYRLLHSALVSGDPDIADYFRRYRPALVVLGSCQRHVVTGYAYHARTLGVPCVGGVGSWDQLTMDGPVAPGMSEYWVWNDVMREELETYHGVPPSQIAVVGAPLFDAYATLDVEAARREAMEVLDVPVGARVLTMMAYMPRLGYGEPSIAEHIARQIEKGTYGDVPVYLVIRSYPRDPSFKDRYGHLARYPFVRLYHTPSVNAIDPERYRHDTFLLGGMLAISDVVLTGPGTVVIDAACFDTPVVNFRFDGIHRLPKPLSARAHFSGDHYRKLLATSGTTVVDSFDELDAAIRRYLQDPTADAEGRRLIRERFAGWTDGRLAADKMAERMRAMTMSAESVAW